MVSKTHRQYLTQSRWTGKDEKTPVSLWPVRRRVITLDRKCDCSCASVWLQHHWRVTCAFTVLHFSVCVKERGRHFSFPLPPSPPLSFTSFLLVQSFLSSSISPSLPLSSSPPLLERCAPTMFLQWGVAIVAGQTDRSVVELYYRCWQ